MSQHGVRTRQPVGTAVLVHGGWGHPDDWTWVRRLLEEASVEVVTPDLPTHRSRTATFAEDVDDVRQAIRRSTPPVVAVGWSYGGDVVSVAAEGEKSVVHLVFVAGVPTPATSDPTDDDWVRTAPHILVDDDGAFVLDNAWWFENEAKRLFAGDVLEHLRRTPRRTASRATATEPREGAAWRSLPTTVLVGREGHLISATDRQWLDANLDDVRHLDTDHFILFHQPEAVVQAVLQALAGGSAAGPGPRDGP
jgi:pimeloyl-ACP methyl ester carboxylesterase